jgi:hypothetical protein
MVIMVLWSSWPLLVKKTNTQDTISMMIRKTSLPAHKPLPDEEYQFLGVSRLVPALQAELIPKGQVQLCKI